MNTVRDLINVAPDPMLAVDHDGEIVAANRIICFLLGYREDDLLYNKVEMLVPERFRPHHADFREMYQKDPRTRLMGSGLDLYVQHRQGHDIPVDIALSHTDTDQGPVTLASMRVRQAEIDLMEAQRRAVTAVASKAVRRPVIMAGIIFVLIDLIITLSVVIILANATRESDAEHSRVSCKNTSAIAAIVAANTRTSERNTKGLEAQGFTFGLPKKEFDVLVAQSNAQNRSYIAALNALANANCKSLKAPRIPRFTTTS